MKYIKKYVLQNNSNLKISHFFAETELGQMTGT